MVKDLEQTLEQKSYDYIDKGLANRCDKFTAKWFYFEEIQIHNDILEYVVFTMSQTHHER